MYKWLVIFGGLGVLYWLVTKLDTNTGKTPSLALRSYPYPVASNPSSPIVKNLTVPIGNQAVSQYFVNNWDIQGYYNEQETLKAGFNDSYQSGYSLWSDGMFIATLFA